MRTEERGTPTPAAPKSRWKAEEKEACFPGKGATGRLDQFHLTDQYGFIR